LHLAPKSVELIFDGLGREYRLIPDNKDKMIEAIKESISKGRPVIARGIVGPPDCGIVTGYGNQGEVLYGISYFQDDSTKGYYEKSNWYEDMERALQPKFCAIVVGNRYPNSPSKYETFISSLEWAIELERKPKLDNLPDHANGLAAYDAWADALEKDADYPKDDPEMMNVRMMIHGDQAMMLEERRYAANYLRSMAVVVPEVSDQLNEAAVLYDEVASYMGKVWPWGCEMGSEIALSLADHNTRTEIAKNVRIAKEKEEKAVEYLEKAQSILLNT
jgi:hypothetical protein